MIQWEYNMQKLPFDEHLVRRLNDIGEDGWECILVKYDTNLLKTNGFYFFKRPKE